MRLKVSSSSEYKKIRAVWYSKLKAEGFDDIEQDEDNLKVWSSDKFGRNKGMIQNGGFEAKAEYFRLATMFCAEYEFETELDRIIWTYHAEGLNNADITKLLREAKLIKTKTDRQYVWTIVNRLRVLMKAKYIGVKTEEDTDD